MKLEEYIAGIEKTMANLPYGIAELYKEAVIETWKEAQAEDRKRILEGLPESNVSCGDCADCMECNCEARSRERDTYRQEVIDLINQ